MDRSERFLGAPRSVGPRNDRPCRAGGLRFRGWRPEAGSRTLEARERRGKPSAALKGSATRAGGACPVSTDSASRTFNRKSYRQRQLRRVAHPSFWEGWGLWLLLGGARGCELISFETPQRRESHPSK